MTVLIAQRSLFLGFALLACGIVCGALQFGFGLLNLGFCSLDLLQASASRSRFSRFAFAKALSSVGFGSSSAFASGAVSELESSSDSV